MDNPKQHEEGKNPNENKPGQAQPGQASQDQASPSQAKTNEVTTCWWLAGETGGLLSRAKPETHFFRPDTLRSTRMRRELVTPAAAAFSIAGAPGQQLFRLGSRFKTKKSKTGPERTPDPTWKSSMRIVICREFRSKSQLVHTGWLTTWPLVCGFLSSFGCQPPFGMAPLLHEGQAVGRTCLGNLMNILWVWQGNRMVEKEGGGWRKTSYLLESFWGRAGETI